MRQRTSMRLRAVELMEPSIYGFWKFHACMHLIVESARTRPVARIKYSGDRLNRQGIHPCRHEVVGRPQHTVDDSRSLRWAPRECPPPPSWRCPDVDSSARERRQRWGRSPQPCSGGPPALDDVFAGDQRALARLITVLEAGPCPTPSSTSCAAGPRPGGRCPCSASPAPAARASRR